MNQSTRPALVLACGNPLRGDDGVAWRIADALCANLASDAVEVISAHQWLPEHAEEIGRATQVIFVDCSAVGEPGTVETVEVNPCGDQPRPFTHHFDPASLLQLSWQLYGRKPSQALLVTIGGGTFELKESLSTAVATAVPRAVECIQRFLGIPVSP